MIPQRRPHHATPCHDWQRHATPLTTTHIRGNFKPIPDPDFRTYPGERTHTHTNTLNNTGQLRIAWRQELGVGQSCLLLASDHIASHRIASHHVALRHVTSRHFTPRRVLSRHAASRTGLTSSGDRTSILLLLLLSPSCPLLPTLLLPLLLLITRATIVAV